MTWRTNVQDIVNRNGHGAGQVFFVSSVTGSSGNGGTRADYAKATIAQAVALCTANRGDVIYLLPGHVETITAAGGIAIATAGISIIGIGNGSERPTITWGTSTAATWTVTAANVLIENIITKVSLDSIVSMFVVSAAGVRFNRVAFVETGSVQTLIWILTTSAADDLTIENCRCHQAAAGATKWIDLVGADRAIIRNNLFHVNCTTHVIGGTTTASLEVFIDNNLIVNPADAATILLLAASTGLVSYNSIGSGKTAIAGSVALASAYGVQNLSVNTVNTSGILDPVADT